MQKLTGVFRCLPCALPHDLCCAGLAEFARAGLRDPAFVRLDADQQLSPDLSLSFLTVR